MKTMVNRSPAFIISGLVVLCLWVSPVSAKKDQAEIVKAELATIANQLSLRPEIAIDLTAVSGAYCFNTGLGKGGHMTHYAVDPTKNDEDVIDFVNAASLVQAGTSVQKLPQFPGTLGSMKANRWYYLPAGENEPHHGVKFPFPLMIRASNIK